jgi:RNA polymerase sigma-70 factor (ECF subfamily)
MAAVLASRDLAAFGTLMARHEQAVRAFLKQLCRGQIHLVDDLAQETFIKAFDKLHQARDGSRLRPWLNGIAYREFLMAQRASRRYGEALNELAREPVAHREPDPAALELDRLLSVLSAAERSAIVLNHGGGLSHQEVARAPQQETTP